MSSLSLPFATPKQPTNMGFGQIGAQALVPPPPPGKGKGKIPPGTYGLEEMLGAADEDQQGSGSTGTA